MSSLAVKYRPQTFEDVVEQGIVVKMLQGICSAENVAIRNFLLIGPAGVGKAQPLWSSVLTVNAGKVAMRDIKCGDIVYTHTGAQAPVIGVFPQGERFIYRLILENDSYIDVADNHINVIKRGNCTYLENVETTNLLQYIKYNTEIYLPIFNNKTCTSDTYLKLVKIVPLGIYECRCIYINHPDHTYITDNDVVTHNTTLGRIIAGELNNGQGSPIEIDAASNNSAESTRKLVTQAHTYPIGCKYKVFIIDECHALSPAACGTLLKVLEESPARSIFVLCTTNPEKIPATILSRVQTFQLSKISLDGIYSRLKYVMDTEISNGEQISYEDDALKFIAKLANGGMRDSLTLLDTALTYSKAITSRNLQYALNLPNYDSYFELLTAYAKHDNVCIAQIVDNVYNSGVNFVKWFDQFHSFVVNIIKYILLQDINSTMIPSHYVDKLAKYTTAHYTICIKLAGILIRLNKDLRGTQYLQETALTYLCSAKGSV